MDLIKIASEIREIIKIKQSELQLTFEEDSHRYEMIDLDGNLRSDWPSVSKIMKLFYTEFPKEEVAYKKAKGDKAVADKLIMEWEAAGTYSTNLGSRTHFFLEKDLIGRYGDFKSLRQPIYECDFEQIVKSDTMISAGIQYIELMLFKRNGVLVDTEMVLGSNRLGYTGQPDKVWLFLNEKNELGFVITDWKTNKIKNFEVNFFTKQMRPPFQSLPDNALGHYNIQLPFYGKLLLDMLKGTKYENIKLFGCVIVLLKEDGTFEEFRVNKNIINIILNMDLN